MTPRTQLRVQRGRLAQAVGQLYDSSVAVLKERAISSQYCVLLVVFICHVVELGSAFFTKLLDIVITQVVSTARTNDA